uniref:SGNH domain-containing protein n=1 Tax=Panagrolaimus davidi TaxID=227884 RepID=A0A914PXD8_9BILA
MLCTIVLPRLASSFFVIAIVSGIISMSTSQYDPFKTITLFSNFHQHLVVLGDISYILYLIHWPLITYARFTSSQTVFTYFFGSMLFATSIFLARVGHNVIEKPLLRACTSFHNFIVILIFLYAFAFFVPLTLKPTPTPSVTDPKDVSNDKNLTLKFWETITKFDTPLILPPKWSKKNDIEVANKLRGELMGGIYKCQKQEKVKVKFWPYFIFYCEIAGTNPNATKTSMIIGNSFSMNTVAAISANPIFSKTYSIWTNDLNFPLNDSFEETLIENYIKPLKPDVLFIVQKYFQKYLFNTPIEKIPERKEFKYWNNVLQNIEKYTSAIILCKGQLAFPYDISQDFIRRKATNLPIASKIKIGPRSPVMEAWLTSLNCSKCHFFDYREAFCDGDFCQIMDFVTDLPLFRDKDHISPLGVRKLKPFLDRAVNEALGICTN